MCFPLLIGLAGTAMSVAGALQQGSAAKSQADAQAQAYRQQADQELKQGQYEGDRIKEQGNQTIGRQVAGTAGAGVNMDGSPADVTASTASSVELDRSARMYGATAASQNDRYQAKLSQISGKNAQTGSYFNAAGSLFGGLGKTISGYDPNKAFLTNAFSMGG